MEDDGIGIAPEHLDRIWNRFYRWTKRTDRERQFRTGLALVKWIAEAHGAACPYKANREKAAALQYVCARRGGLTLYSARKSP